MGFIREPKGVDFVIKSDPLTDKDREEISTFIANYKAKNSVPKGSRAVKKLLQKRKSKTTS